MRVPPQSAFTEAAASGLSKQKNMYYKDTGWTAYRLFELEL